MSESLYSGIVLAGGASRRMGRDKRFLDLDGESLLARVLARLRPLVSELIVVTRDPEPLAGLGARVVTDRYPGMGVLAGVHAGLSAARNAWAFVVAGDMPLLNPALLRAMAEMADAATTDAVVPCWNGMFEPLHGLYRVAACAPAAERVLLAGRRRIIAFYSEVRVHAIPEADVRCWDPSGDSFCNVNTPEEWEAALRRL
jgi:molybdopterin-guanine dinucleotide biosynthesis protein A